MGKEYLITESENVTLCSQEKAIEVTPEYLAVLKLLEDRQTLTLVCGKAGSGKTTLIDYLRNEMGNQKNIVVVAPTGVAALNAQGQTIHSFFRFPPHLLAVKDIRRLNSNIYRNIDILIIDEISMVRADILDNIDHFLRINTGRPGDPFGGVQVLLIGDLYQLPPIATDALEIEYLRRAYGDHSMFWKSRVVQVYGMAVVELHRIFRQQDPEFTDLLNQVRVADNVEKVLPVLNSLGAPDSQKPSSLITLTATNRVAEDINNERLSRLPGKALCADARVSGEFKLGGSHVPAPEHLLMKKGAQVMFTKNDEERQWVNGSLGRILDVLDEKPYPRVSVELLTSLTSEYGRSEVSVYPVEWQLFRYDIDEKTNRISAKTIGSYRQYPLMLAWAITIHKSQGKTLERVRIDLGSGAFASGQTYVALSRCKSVRDLTLASPLRHQDILCDPHVNEFFSGLQGYQVLDSGVEVLRYGDPSTQQFRFQERSQSDDEDFRY